MPGRIDRPRAGGLSMKLSRLRTKRPKVKEGLRLVVRLRRQARALKMLKGLGWEGDLGEMRQDRPSPFP
jgi:hypothetical protein